MSDSWYCDNRAGCDDTADELAKLKKRTEWKSIESAPKNGDTFLGLVISDYAGRDHREHFYYLCAWDDEQDCFRQVDDGQLAIPVGPTVWMPLPDPPTT
jgi:hypothetical protein